MLLADLRADQRWPVFTARADALGVRSLLCVPMGASERKLGVLCLYAVRPCAFTDRDETIAALLADHATIVLQAAGQRERLTRAVASLDVIAQAKRIRMAGHELGVERAFAVLVRFSQHTNRELHDLDEQIAAQRRLASLLPRPRKPIHDTAPAVALQVRTSTAGAVVELSGEIDTQAAPSLGQRLSGLPAAADLDVDISQVTFLSTAGLTVLLRLRARLATSGASLRLINISPITRRVITLAGLQDVLPCLPASTERTAAARRVSPR